MTPFTAELIGTMFLILLGAGVVANVILKGTKGNAGGWMVITTGWALAVFVGVVIAGPYSGAHLNPAVSIGLAIAGKFQWSEVPMYILAQLVGAMLGAFLAWCIYRDHFNATTDADTVLAVFSTGPAIRNTTFNVLSEVIGTFVLLFVVFYFTEAEIKNPLSPIGLGSLGAIPVAFLISKLSSKIGNFPSLMIVIFFWVLICIAAYLIPKGNVMLFYVLGACVGFVMGGIQSLSRSTYSKLMPETKDTASFFSFYDVTEKIAVVIGMFSFGYITELTGSQRNSVLALMSFFIVGLLILIYANITQKKSLRAV